VDPEEDPEIKKQNDEKNNQINQHKEEVEKLEHEILSLMKQGP
jgi:hypothetical protein